MIDFLDILNWIRDNQILYWCLWFSAIVSVYAVFEGIGNCIKAWRNQPPPPQQDSHWVYW